MREKQKEVMKDAIIISGNITKANWLFDETKRRLFDSELDTKSSQGYRVLVIDRQGLVINDSNKKEIGKTMLVPEVMEALDNRDIVTYKEDKNVIYVVASIANEDSEKVGAVLIVASIEDIFDPINEIEKNLLVFILITFVIITFLVYFIAKFLIDPLKNVLTVVQKMADGHLSERITIKGYDEFSDLGEAFNEMAGKLEQMEKTREEFVSNVSHELKTPLSSVKVLSDSILLQENMPAEIYVEFLQDINSEIDRMTNIINDLLTLVKQDQREIGPNLQSIDANKMLSDIIKRLSPLAHKKNINLTLEEVKKIVIDADEMKLSLAISNLVENAIKYTMPGGKVKLIIDNDHQNAFITVQDTGIGISEEEQKKVFNRFYRIDKTRDRETGGTGLGLSITLSTVLLHKGSIRLTSKENEGSTFIVRLPIQLRHKND